MLLLLAQNRSISGQIYLENNHKIGRFLPIAFWWSLPRKLQRNSHEIGRFFPRICPYLKIPRNLTFSSTTYQKPWLKEKFLPVSKSCTLSLTRVISCCFAKKMRSFLSALQTFQVHHNSTYAQLKAWTNSFINIANKNVCLLINYKILFTRPHRIGCEKNRHRNTTITLSLRQWSCVLWKTNEIRSF